MRHWLSPLLLYRSHCGKQDLVFARLGNQQSVVLLNDGDANLTMELPFGLPDADTRAIAVGRLSIMAGLLSIVAFHLGSQNLRLLQIKR
jgi:hypothetical protein